MEYKVLISLGSNLGDREKNINNALTLIHKDLGKIIAVSELYETISWGYNDFPYLNNGICLMTALPPFDLLDALLKIEIKLGRKHTINQNYQARIIDLDIVLIKGQIINIPNLIVPHPRMNLRRFVLQPLADISPDWIHEIEGLSIKELLFKCADTTDVKYYGKIPLYCS